jgi:hypothetical protein
VIGTVEGFRSYHTARGNSLPADAQTSVATAALVRGSDYVRAKFDLLVAETDQRVIDAAYVAGGQELALINDVSSLLPFPGFWVTLETGKVLTKVDGIEWTLKDMGSETSDAMTVQTLVRSKLRGAIKPEIGIMVV